MLEGSEIADKVRKLVLNDSDDVFTPTTIEQPKAEPVNALATQQQKQHNDILYIDSRDVAEMVGKRHDHVMRDIRTIIEHLGGQSKIAESYFIESTYINSQNKQQLCYLLTKKGCELFATRMTGAKGTQFAITYIEKFNKMEEQLKSQVPIHSYMIADPTKRAEQWIEEHSLPL